MAVVVMKEMRERKMFWGVKSKEINKGFAFPSVIYHHRLCEVAKSC